MMMLPQPGIFAKSAIDYLRELGHEVQEQDIPGLYRIDGGPELTIQQLIGIALNASWLKAPARTTCR